MNSQSRGITTVETPEHATSVIKSLRSLSHSQQHYQRNAESSDHIVSTLSDFNSIVSSSATMVAQKQATEARMIRAIEKFEGKAEALSDDETPRGRKDEKSSFQPRVTSGAASFDSDSDDDDDMRFPPAKQGWGEQFDTPKKSPAGGSEVWEDTSSVLSPPRRSGSWDDLRDDNDDDDDEDTKELLSGFVAPTIATSSSFRGGGGSAAAAAKSGRLAHSLRQKTAESDDLARMKIPVSGTAKAKTPAGLQLSQQPEFGTSNPRIIVKPGQRIVVKARGRKADGSH